MSAPICYSVRLLSPFRGMLQMVELANSRAMSDDGIHWQVHVHVESRNPIWGELEGSRAHSRFMVFGTWAAQTGLRRLPFDPMADMATAQVEAGHITEALQTVRNRIPFPARDNIELWLVDRSAAPVALLASVREAEPRPDRGSYTWHAAGPPGDPGEMKVSAEATSLARYINRVAHDARWFQRGTHGSGRPLHPGHNEPELNTATVEAAAFPELLLRADWPESDSRQLAESYLRQQAPRLLTLPHLCDETRDRLEREATRQALAVAHYFRLFPKILNPELIDAARVEAQIRKNE